MKWCTKYLLCLLIAVTISVTTNANTLSCRYYTQAPDNQITPYQKNTQSLLWEIRPAQSQTPVSYLFGTIHSADPGILAITTRLERFIVNADVFALESLLQDTDKKKLAKLLFYDPRQSITLATKLEKTFYQNVEKILLNYHIPAQTITKMRPWFAALQMGYSTDPGPPLDTKLLQFAKNQNIPQLGLEDAFQAIQIFATLPENQQIKILKDATCNYDTSQEILDTVEKMYLQSNLSNLVATAMGYQIEGETLYDELNLSLIDKRNIIFINALIPKVDEKSHFIAVGALHLFGEHGMIEMLKARGYQVNPIIF